MASINVTPRDFDVLNFKLIDLTNYPNTFSEPPDVFIYSKKQVPHSFCVIQ